MFYISWKNNKIGRFSAFESRKCQQLNTCKKNKTIFDRLFFIYSTLVFFESLLGIGTSLGDLQDVEADSFAEWSTFTYSHNVSHLHVPVNIQSSTYVANITTNRYMQKHHTMEDIYKHNSDNTCTKKDIYISGLQQPFTIVSHLHTHSLETQNQKINKAAYRRMKNSRKKSQNVFGRLDLTLVR